MQGDTAGVGMSFAVLGPLDVRRDGQPVEVGGRRLRALLTLLLLDAGRTVSTEALVAGVWDDRPPSGVGNALQALVSRLRATVDRGLVVGGPSGYRLAVSPDQVDLHRFARLAGEGAAALAAGDPGRAAGLLREALGLWRGAPLTHLPDAEVEVARLEGLRIAAAEDRIEAELALGGHADLIPELRLLVAAHPLRERPHGQLMRALYGAGRRVEALAGRLRGGPVRVRRPARGRPLARSGRAPPRDAEGRATRGGNPAVTRGDAQRARPGGAGARPGARAVAARRAPRAGAT
ncbi:AfsR/SARP family transcriptional regulator [Microbispora bryophytorum]|uniref:AfsR/SARP family transcriptional regulator n=1 Tax=Microbispora bryophytorum TaxID=1460882 RepID=UPI0033F53479